jgi:hypothetical protein
MVTSRAVVGSSAIRSAGWQTLMGILVEPAFGGADADLAEDLDCRPAGALAALAAVDAQHLGDLEADAQGRVQTGHRLLEDHADAVAPHRPQRAFVELGEI